jgi:hypothetical protein
MSLIVETGNHEPGANSYCSVQHADVYHALYGNSDWAGDTASKELALIVACQSLDLLYGPKFLSAPLEENDSLLWPRYPYYDKNGKVRNTGVPKEVLDAQAELALMYMAGVDVFPEGSVRGAVASESVTVGDISTSTTYTATGKKEVATYDGFRKIDLLLWPVLKGRVGLTFLSR